MSAGVSGWVVGAYALSVAIGAIVMALLTAGRNRAVVLRLLVGLFVVGNAASALALTYGMLLTGRIVAALCHGAYMGISAAIAADLMPPDRKSRGVAVVFSGITLAIVFGLPVGSFLGQHLGWRLTFAVMTALGVTVFGALLRFVPASADQDARRTHSELGWLRSAQVWLRLVVSVLGFGGVFGAFSYLAYTLVEATGLSENAVTVMLFCFGVGTFVGNVVGGGRAAAALGDRFLVAAPAVVTAVMVVLALTAGSSAAATIVVLLMGAVGFSLTPGTQARVLTWSGGASLASSANIAALNLGNWIGATASGIALDAGLGATSPLYVGAALTGLGAVVMAVAAGRARAQNS